MSQLENQKGFRSAIRNIEVRLKKERMDGLKGHPLNVPAQPLPDSDAAGLTSGEAPVQTRPAYPSIPSKDPAQDQQTASWSWQSSEDEALKPQIEATGSFLTEFWIVPSTHILRQTRTKHTVA